MRNEQEISSNDIQRIRATRVGYFGFVIHRHRFCSGQMWKRKENRRVKNTAEMWK
jgi:hypothetical protein